MHMPDDDAPFRPIWHDTIGLETRRQHPAANVTRKYEEAKKGRGASPHTYIHIHIHIHIYYPDTPPPRSLPLLHTLCTHNDTLRLRHAHLRFRHAHRRTSEEQTSGAPALRSRRLELVLQTSAPQKHSSEPEPGKKRSNENEHKHA